LLSPTSNPLISQPRRRPQTRNHPVPHPTSSTGAPGPNSPSKIASARRCAALISHSASSPPADNSRAHCTLGTYAASEPASVEYARR